MIQIFSFLRNWIPKSQMLTPQQVNPRGSTAQRPLSGEDANLTMPPRQVLPCSELHLQPRAMAYQQTLTPPAGAWQCRELKALPIPGQELPQQMIILLRGQAAGRSPAQTRRLHTQLWAPGQLRSYPTWPPLLAWTAASSTSMRPKATVGGIPRRITRQLPGKLQLWGSGWFLLSFAPLSSACAVALLLSQPGAAATGEVTINP